MLCPVLVITGTTAVGKTKLSLELAQRLNGEIISADSVQVNPPIIAHHLYHQSFHHQVYRHMDIGSAKVNAATRGAVPHHLIDIIDPSQPFNAGDYHDEACRALEVMTKL